MVSIDVGGPTFTVVQARGETRLVVALEIERDG